jgi:hypothetical protein
VIHKSGDLPGRFEYRLPQKGQGFVLFGAQLVYNCEKPGFLAEEAGFFLLISLF